MTDLTMSQFASKDDLLAAQAARIAELESQLEAIGAGGVEPLRKPAAAPQAVQAAVPEAIEQMAVDRYKVVPSHESMFHRWAVVAGNGTQQLYIGREVECQNMALKFAGAFLDGAFVAMQNTAPAHPVEAVQAAVPEGWKLAPIKPTPEMCHVGRYGGDKDAPAYGEKPVEGVTAWPFVADHTAEQIYQSMLAAAPAHPAEGVPAQAVAVADARSARQIADAIVENFKDAGWSTSSIDDARVLEAVSAAIGEHGATEPLTGVASDVDSMARVLMAAFAKAEPEPPITRYPTSFVATFADMARAAIAAAQLADGVPAQSYVADFFREKGFYPSLAQAFAAGVAHAAAMPAQTVDEIMELADEYAGAQACAVTATSTADADTTKERNALLSAIRAALAATQPAAQGMDAIRALIAQHSKELEHNHYAYFELAYTRRTGWMVWITDKPAFRESVLVNPDRKVLASGQGDTPEAACAAALAAQAKQGGAA